jgi:hypothetical protein
MTQPGKIYLTANGMKVDTQLLQARPIRRCLPGECQSHCCGWGVDLNVKEAEDILAHAELVQPHLPPERRDPALWFDDTNHAEYDHPDGGRLTGTSVVDDATHPTGHNCLFLRADRKCALQVAGIAAGEHPWRYKPFYCASHPLTFDHKKVTLDDTNPLYLKGGSCHRPTADGATVPVYQLFEPEMRLLLGDDGYAELDALARR